MNELQAFSIATHFAIAFMSLWFLAFVCFRSYRIDALRERLFALRDELFSCAASGEVDFNDPAYVKLRLLLNSFIRFAHQITFVRFAMVTWLTPDMPDIVSPMDEWRQAMKRLPAQPRKKLDSIHRRAEVLIVRQMALGSPLLLLGLLAIAPFLVISGAARRVREAMSVLADKLPGLDLFQSRTVLADTKQRQAFHEESHAHG